MKSGKLFIYLFSLLALSAQSTPDISVEIYRFKTDAVSYIELSMYIVGTSLVCKDISGSSYGVEYLVFVKDTGEQIIAGNRYKLSHTGCPAQDIMDVRRFVVPPGNYTVEIEAYDLLDTHSVIKVNQEITIDDNGNSISMSDIQLLSVMRSQQDDSSTMNKSGLYTEPLPFRFYYPALNQLSVYLETYLTDQLEGQPYLQYSIKPVNGDIPSPMVTYKKVRKEPVAVNVFQLDISSLISGVYMLEASLYDGNKQLKASGRVGFTRSNPVGDSIYLESYFLQAEGGFAKGIPEDSLDYDLKAMAPIVSSMDVDIMNALLQKGSSKAKRFFIHRYWTNQAGKLAGPAFYSYMKVARVVDENYRSGFGYGFETDRGHIFLKYGKPDDVIDVEDEPSAPPYEIWFYNTFPATHQNNVRFLFYNPTLARNAHRLLHSTALGEVRNERWEIELYRDATLETPGVNDRVMGDNVHRNARKYFEN